MWAHKHSQNGPFCYCTDFSYKDHVQRWIKSKEGLTMYDNIPERLVKNILVDAYYQGYGHCIKMIKRGVKAGLSFEDSLECCKKSLTETREVSNVR